MLTRQLVNMSACQHVNNKVSLALALPQQGG
jgi:hypothetical protein